MAKLRPEIQKLCMLRTFTIIEKLMGVATKLAKVLGELGEIPYEPLKEEQEKGVFKDHDGEIGHCFKQHTHQFLQGECA
jgi:hypothetical protein